MAPGEVDGSEAGAGPDPYAVARRDMRNSSTMSIMKISTEHTAKAPRIAVKKRLAT